MGTPLMEKRPLGRETDMFLEVLWLHNSGCSKASKTFRAGAIAEEVECLRTVQRPRFSPRSAIKKIQRPRKRMTRDFCVAGRPVVFAGCFLMKCQAGILFIELLDSIGRVGKHYLSIT